VNAKMEFKPKDVKTVRISDLPPRATVTGVTEEMLADVKKNGIKNPIVIDKETGTVLDGNTRASAAKRLGIKEVPVIYVKEADYGFDAIQKNSNEFSKTKSQLTDLWKKAQEKPIDTSLPEQLKPDVTPTTVEKGESVTAKKMNERFGKDEQMSTEYDVIGINNESDKAASLILKDRNKAIKTAFTDTGSNTEKIAILNELFEKSVVDNDHELSAVLFNRIKQLSTQTAQSLNMFKALTEVNPHYSYMSEVVSARLNGVRLSAGNIIDALKKESKQSRVRTKLSKQTQELKETLSNSVKYEKAQKVFNDLIC
jgi:protein-arginine kinase activator protein McsA